MFAHAVRGEDPDIWLMTSVHWQVTLAPREIAMTAWAALRALDPDLAEDTVSSALGEHVDPLPAFTSEMEDTRFWASMASRRKLKVYALATFEAMHPKDRAAFLDYVTTDRRAAA